MAVEATTPADLEFQRKSAEVEAENKGRSGVGLRKAIGKTRGKGSVTVTWERFDESQPDTLPKSIKEFNEITKVSDEPTLLAYLIEGFNSAAYTAASDPLAEFVNPAWSDEVQTQFRTVVRNYARGVNVSIEDAVKLIKPGFDASFTAAKK